MSVTRHRAKMANADNVDNLVNLNAKFNIAQTIMGKFDPNIDSVDHFVANCDRAMAVCNDPATFFLICSRILGSASDKIRQFKEWVPLKTFLLKEYGTQGTEVQYRQQLYNCKQSYNENIASYYSRFYNISQCLTDCIGRACQGNELATHLLKLNNELLTLFISGLRRDIKFMVKAQRPTTLSEAKGLAEQEEVDIQADKTRFAPQQRDKTCYICKRDDHIAKYCDRNRTENISFHTRVNGNRANTEAGKNQIQTHEQRREKYLPNRINSNINNDNTYQRSNYRQYDNYSRNNHPSNNRNNTYYQQNGRGNDDRRFLTLEQCNSTSKYPTHSIEAMHSCENEAQASGNGAGPSTSSQ